MYANLNLEKNKEVLRASNYNNIPHILEYRLLLLYYYVQT